MGEPLSEDQVQQVLDTLNSRHRDGTFRLRPSVSQINAVAEMSVELLKKQYRLPTQREFGYLIGLAAAFTFLNIAIGYQTGSVGAGAKLNEVGVSATLATIDQGAKKAQLLLQSDLIPVGTILAWHKNPNVKPDGRDTGPALELPDGWMECGGKKFPKGTSPLLLATGATHTPNLNSVKNYNGGRFLRGAAESGKFEKDAIKQHKHSGPTHDNEKANFVVQHDSFPKNTAPSTPYTDGHVLQPHTGLSERQTEVDEKDETRPVNMSVVWIIRVK